MKFETGLKVAVRLAYTALVVTMTLVLCAMFLTVNDSKCSKVTINWLHMNVQCIV